MTELFTLPFITFWGPPLFDLVKLEEITQFPSFLPKVLTNFGWRKLKLHTMIYHNDYSDAYPDQKQLLEAALNYVWHLENYEFLGLNDYNVM